MDEKVLRNTMGKEYSGYPNSTGSLLKIGESGKIFRVRDKEFY